METQSPKDKETNDPVADLQLQKLQLEVESLSAKTKWENSIGRYLPFLTAVIAVAGLWFSNYQFNSKFNAEQTQRAEEVQKQLERDTAARERESRKPFWEKQIALYFEASTSAATIATLPLNHPERKTAEEKFRLLYWGPLALVEDQAVKEAMVQFGSCLDGRSKECDSEIAREVELRNLSLNLANKCRKSISVSWNIDLNSMAMPNEKP
ncbi:MAG: hypothetical protein H7Y30_02355 [Pyrinomonadaceae bacterium]|nr:hypothetical protein [Pyrinomonadaceae bacterium]